VDDDGGLVVATSESMTCLSCPHSDGCGHKHRAGAALARPTHPAHHTSNDMDKYRDMVHSALSDDGTRLRLRGKSSCAIDWASLQATFAMTTLHQTIRTPKCAHLDDDDMDVLGTGTVLGADCSAGAGGVPVLAHVDIDGSGPGTGLVVECSGSRSPSPTPHSDSYSHASSTAGSPGHSDERAPSGVSGHRSPSPPTPHSDSYLHASSTAGSPGHSDERAPSGVADSAVLAIGRRFRSVFLAVGSMNALLLDP
jgi:hypothetical protein